MSRSLDATLLGLTVRSPAIHHSRASSWKSNRFCPTSSKSRRSYKMVQVSQFIVNPPQRWHLHASACNSEASLLRYLAHAHETWHLEVKSCWPLLLEMLDANQYRYVSAECIYSVMQCMDLTALQVVIFGKHARVWSACGPQYLLTWMHQQP